MTGEDAFQDIIDLFRRDDSGPEMILVSQSAYEMFTQEPDKRRDPAAWIKWRFQRRDYA